MVKKSQPLKKNIIILCLSGQEMAPTGQRPLLNDSWRHNSILWAEQLADSPIAYITSVIYLLCLPSLCASRVFVLLIYFKCTVLIRDLYLSLGYSMYIKREMTNPSPFAFCHTKVAQFCYLSSFVSSCIVAVTSCPSYLA